MNHTLFLLFAILMLFPLHLGAEGRQVSKDGIRHSFLVSGKFTALISEESKVVWAAVTQSKA